MYLLFQVQQDVGAAVLSAGAGRARRTYCNGGAGYIQRSHVSSVRPRHEHGLPLREGGLSHQILRGKHFSLCSETVTSETMASPIRVYC